MGIIKQFSGTLRPSAMMRRVLKHDGNASESDKRRPLANRTVLGCTVRFFCNGESEVDGVFLTEEESHNSQILRFAHASLLINAPVGDKKLIYVDATRDPVDCWVYGAEALHFVSLGTSAVKSGLAKVDELVESDSVPFIRSII